MVSASRIVTPFGAGSTAAEVVAGIDLAGRRAIVTGGASGIGVETARALAGAGAEVTLAVRNIEAGDRTAEDIIATTGNKQVLVAPLDLADRASVAGFVAGWEGPLHVLVNNAGVMGNPETRTTEGWELQFATNHFGHFGLTTGLRAALAAAGGARVVSVTSSAHLRSPVVFADIHFRERPYDPWLAYGQSKTANVLFAVEADEALGGRRHHGQRGDARRDPDQPAAPPLARRSSTAARTPAGLVRWKTPEQGAATSVLVATAPLLDGIGGRYFEDCNEAEPDQPGTRRGVAAYALDPEAAERLWEVSVAALAQ